MRHPAVLTTLQEDLRAIGLIREEDDKEKDAPKADPEGGQVGDKPDEKAGDKSDKMKAEAADDEEPCEDCDKPQSEATDDEKDDAEKQDEAAARQYVAALSRSFLKSHVPLGQGPVESKKKSASKTVSETKAPAKKPKVESKKTSKTSKTSKVESRSQRVYRLAKGQILESRVVSPTIAGAGSKVSRLLNEVSDIMGSIHRAKKQEQIQGFANIAVISEMLSRRFQTIAMRLSEGTLYKVAGSMSRLSEQASDMAITLDTPSDEKDKEKAEVSPDDERLANLKKDEAEGDDAQVDSLFKKLMAKLLDALQLYNDVTGKEEPEMEDDEIPGDDDDAEEMPPTDEGDDLPADADAPLPPPSSDKEEEGDESPEGSDDDEEEPKAEGDEEPCEGDDCDEPKAEGEENPYGDPDDEKTMSEAKKALKRILGKKKLVSGKARKGKARK